MLPGLEESLLQAVLHKEKAMGKKEEPKNLHSMSLESRRDFYSILITLIAVSFSLFHLYTAFFGLLGGLLQRSIHLAFAMTLTFLLFPGIKGGMKKVSPLGISMAVAGIVCAAYLVVEYEALSFRMGRPTFFDIALGIIEIILLLEMTRRVIGLTLPFVAILFLLYAYFGPYLPESISHRGYEFTRIVSQMYLTTEGIFGIPLGVSATFVILFIIFGAFLQASGGGQFFLDLALALFGRVRGGPAKIAVVASAFFGTISGSAVANVMGTGTFTIPLMKKTGYKPAFAGAVEAVASSGGQLMPPIMGAAAFIMAEILNIAYLHVCLAAAIPALLYYMALLMGVDLEAAKTGLKGLPKEELPRVSTVLKEGWPLLVPPILLVYLLAIALVTPIKAASWSILATIIVSTIRKKDRMNLRKLIKALEDGARGAIEVAAACACAGIVVGVFTLTGLGMVLSGLLIDLAGGNLLFLLFLTMIASLILGMGMPTTACYIVLAILVAPALIKMGVLPIAAHLFVFYFGIISAITPPVALAAYAGAGIAGASPMQTGFIACKLGLAAFLIPYMFVYGPSMLGKGSWVMILWTAISGLLGSACIAAAVQGWILTRLTLPLRIFLAAGGICLIKPGLLTDLMGFAVLLIVLGINFFVFRSHGRNSDKLFKGRI